MNTFVAVPSTGDDTGYVHLARTRTGRLFRKQILREGTLFHPSTGEPINIDSTFVQTLVNNFRDKVCDIVQVPLANDRNQHVEDPDRNIGEVVDVQAQDGNVYAVIDVRDETRAEALGKTLLGASAMMHMNYVDTRTGKPAGPTLLHVAVTNRPYVTGLADYEELVAATNAVVGSEYVVLTPRNEDPKMTRDELIAALKDEHGIDVPALQVQVDELSAAKTEAETKVAEADAKVVEAEQAKAEAEAATTEATAKAEAAQAEVAALSATLSEKLAPAGVLALSNGTTVAASDIVTAVTDLVDGNVALSNRVAALEGDAREAKVDGLIAEGRILPAQREAMIKLSAADADLFASLVPEKPIVALSQEDGSGADTGDTNKFEPADEIKRIVEAYVG